MSYGVKGWADWVLEEEEALPHFKAAWEAGINTWGESREQSGLVIHGSIQAILTDLPLLCRYRERCRSLVQPHSDSSPTAGFALLKEQQSGR